MPLAADESLSVLDPYQLIAARAVRRLVLKPALLGGPGKTLEIARKAAAHDLDLVVTTALDSAAGVWAAAQLAAAVDAIRPGMHHGLDTSRWLQSDTGTPPLVKQGRMVLNEQPGTGFTPYEQYLPV